MNKHPVLQYGIVACGALFAVAYLAYWFVAGPSLPSPRALAEVALHSPDAAAREKAAATLAGHPDASVELLRSIWTDSSDVKVRAAIALGLGAQRDWESMPALVEALEDPSPLLRTRAATAINQVVQEDLGFNSMAAENERAAQIKIIEEKWPALHNLELAKQKFLDSHAQPDKWKARLEKRKEQQN